MALSSELHEQLLEGVRGIVRQRYGPMTPMRNVRWDGQVLALEVSRELAGPVLAALRVTPRAGSTLQYWDCSERLRRSPTERYEPLTALCYCPGSGTLTFEPVAVLEETPSLVRRRRYAPGVPAAARAAPIETPAAPSVSLAAAIQAGYISLQTGLELMNTGGWGSAESPPAVSDEPEYTTGRPVAAPLTVRAVQAATVDGVLPGLSRFLLQYLAREVGVYLRDHQLSPSAIGLEGVPGRDGGLQAIVLRDAAGGRELARFTFGIPSGSAPATVERAVPAVTGDHRPVRVFE